jgi:hypothetical protein
MYGTGTVGLQLELASFRTAATNVAFVLEKNPKTRICSCIAGMMYPITSSLAFCKTVSFIHYGFFISKTIPLRLPLQTIPLLVQETPEEERKRFQDEAP